MRINLRQEIALWVLGLLWMGMALFVLSQHGGIPAWVFSWSYSAEVSPEKYWEMAKDFVWLAPLLIALIVFSLRNRKKPN